MHTMIIPLVAGAVVVPVSSAAAWTGAGRIDGTWAAPAQSADDPNFTFPVYANVAIGRDGRPTGTARLGVPLNCTVRWTAVGQSGPVTTFNETITSAAATTCDPGGTVQLSPASGGRLRYVWTKGNLRSFAYLNGPTGHWRGVIASGGTDAMTDLIIRGTTAGGIEGSVGYGAPLSCSGRWTPLSGNTPGWRRFEERITRASSLQCQGLGIARVRMRGDGQLAYHWTNGPITSTGTLTRAGD